MPKYGILIIHDQQGDLGNGMAAEARVYRMVGGNWNNFRRPTEYKKHATSTIAKPVRTHSEFFKHFNFMDNL